MIEKLKLRVAPVFALGQIAVVAGGMASYSRWRSQAGCQNVKWSTYVCNMLQSDATPAQVSALPTLLASTDASASDAICSSPDEIVAST